VALRLDSAGPREVHHPARARGRDRGEAAPAPLRHRLDAPAAARGGFRPRPGALDEAGKARRVQGRDRLRRLDAGAFHGRGHRLKVEDLYIPLRAVVDLRPVAPRAYRHSEEAALDDGLRAAQEDIALTDAFRCSESHGGRRGLLILGDPGSGKTTHLKRLLLWVLRQGPETLGLPPGTLPVYLPLRLLGTAAGLAQLLESAIARDLPELAAGFAGRLLGRGSLLFLLDGLDEVPAARRKEVSRWIESEARKRRNCRFVVTCRYAGYDDKVRLDGQFLELHLRPLEREQAEAFIRRWFEAVETAFASDAAAARTRALGHANELIERLKEPDFRSSRVFALTRNPLLLTTICLVHRDRGRLPHRRAKLYEDCVNVLLERWREAKDLPVSLDAERSRAVLQPLAWRLHESEKRQSTPEDLAPAIEPVLRGIGWDRGPRSFLETIRDESGLLVGWSGDLYGFMHLGFQEYLAARHFRSLVFSDPKARSARLAELARRFGASWWREVILLMLAIDEPSLFEGFFHEVLARPEVLAHEDLLRECIEEALRVLPEPFLEILDRKPGKANAERLWERQLLAARVVERLAPEAVAARRAALSRHPLLELRERFGAAVPAGAPGVIRSERGEIELVRIPGGRFVMGSDESDPKAFDTEKPAHEVEVGDFEIARHPVTNAQYALYLKASPKAKEPAFWGDARFNRPDQPVVGVSWEEAKAFCDWTGLVLSSEAQWEYACRAGTATRYWSGDGIEDLDRTGWFDKNSGGALHAVGEKPAYHPTRTRSLSSSPDQ
jgi:hypothetical protein